MVWERTIFALAVWGVVWVPAVFEGAGPHSLWGLGAPQLEGTSNDRDMINNLNKHRICPNIQTVHSNYTGARWLTL